MKRSILWLGAAGLLLAATSAAAAAPTCPTPDFARQAKDLITPYLEAESFSGSILVAKDGALVFRESFGAADREWDIANTADTKFRLGSITKQFTAAAILQLVDQGKLSVEDPISKYYTDAPAAWSKVTIKHLLTHASGIPSYTALPGFFREERDVALDPGRDHQADARHAARVRAGHEIQLRQHRLHPAGLCDREGLGRDLCRLPDQARLRAVGA